VAHYPELQPFEYMVFVQPKRDKDGEVVEPGEIVIERTTVLRPSESQVEMVASRAIPDKYMDQLDRVRVVVRPF